MIRFRHLTLIFLFLSPAVAKDEVPLDGEAYLVNEVCAGGVKSDMSILSFQIRGKAAELYFDGMRAKAKQEECYLCEFGYSFSEDAFTFSAEDC